MTEVSAAVPSARRNIAGRAGVTVLLVLVSLAEAAAICARVASPEKAASPAAEGELV
jgi:hypothetical protein